MCAAAVAGWTLLSFVVTGSRCTIAAAGRGGGVGLSGLTILSAAGARRRRGG